MLHPRAADIHASANASGIMDLASMAKTPPGANARIVAGSAVAAAPSKR
jgi:hypothetical protein